MSTGTVIVTAGRFKEFLSDLTPLFPKGSKTIPIGVEVIGNMMTLTCTQGCFYQTILDVNNLDNASHQATILYCNILDFIPTVGDVRLTFSPAGLRLFGEGFDITLPNGYSLVKTIDFPTEDYTPITTGSYIPGLKNLVDMNLSGIYMYEKPITIYRNTAVLKYPNLYAMVKTDSLPFYGVITPEHAKLLCRFGGTSVNDKEPESLIFRRGTSILEIPRKTVNEENNFLSLMEGLSEPININFDSYLERLRTMAKIGEKGHCKLTLFEDGLKTSVNANSIVLADAIGKCGGKLLHVFELPLSMWVMLVKAAGSGQVQILYRSDVVCLRTQSIIMLIRVLA